MTQIAFLGAGNIAQAIMSGIIENGINAKDIWAYDPSEMAMDWIHERGINAASNIDEAIAAADILMLCVKPNVLIELLANISEDVSDKLFVSVAAGVTTTKMASHLPSDTAIVRCMPNTPVQVRTGMIGLFATTAVTDEQRLLVENVLTPVGLIVWVESEADLDSITAISGSGPAYFFLMMESMIAAAQALGLKKDLATKLVLQTSLGAAKVASKSLDQPSKLREKVTSPAGTTEAAITHFQANGFDKIVEGAIKAAHRRSIEMASGS